MQRLDASKQRYDTMIERMQSASEAYRPLASSLHDQIKLMGFDLSPEAMNALQGPAEELNAMAVELYARIDAVLNQEQQDEATIADQDDVLADLDETLLDQDDALAEDSEQEAGE
jgi:ribonuclease HIII